MLTRCQHRTAWTLGARSVGDDLSDRLCHPKPKSARGPSPRTDRRWRSPDAGARTTVAEHRRFCRHAVCKPRCACDEGQSAHWVGVRSTEDDGSSVGNALSVYGSRKRSGCSKSTGKMTAE